jgi:hypothetical protein
MAAQEDVGRLNALLIRIPDEIVPNTQPDFARLRRASPRRQEGRQVRFLPSKRVPDTGRMNKSQGQRLS